MKHFDEPTIEILTIEETDIMTASNDLLSWDVQDGDNVWLVN